MTPDAAAQKRELRHELRGRLAHVTPGERAAWSQAACALLRQKDLWRAARKVLFYAPIGGELDIAPLLAGAVAAGKTAALPRFAPETRTYEAFVVTHLEEDCAPGKFGIAEPKGNCARLDLNALDFVLVPGVGFDLTGIRLGRGQGFYDRLLAKTTAIKCGVAFDLQIVKNIPAEEHDIRMDCLLTPTRWRELPPLEHR